MATASGIPWYAWALLTVICWGTYGVCMHTGSMNMANKDHGRIMAFLWVGLAYFLTAVIAPLIILKIKGGPIDFWAYPDKGLKWSLIAGILGAIGALGVLLAFGASPNPPIYVPVIMSIIRKPTTTATTAETTQAAPYYIFKTFSRVFQEFFYFGCPLTFRQAQPPMSRAWVVIPSTLPADVTPTM